MNDFVYRLQDFLFDILGLTLPGFIFLSLLVMPICFLNFANIPAYEINASLFLSFLKVVSGLLDKPWMMNVSVAIPIIVALSYIFGHVVKVMSIIIYPILATIFDDCLNRGVVAIYRLIIVLLNRYVFVCEWMKRILKGEVGKYLKSWEKVLGSTLEKVFEFRPQQYNKESKPLLDHCIMQICDNLKIEYPKDWYSFYKLGVVANSQEKLSSLASTFLAKYNLYRSLSLIFMLMAVYVSLLFHSLWQRFPPELYNIRPLILVIVGILWLTFHYKFKRYWTLCGNDTLMALFYFWNKKKLNGG